MKSVMHQRQTEPKTKTSRAFWAGAPSSHKRHSPHKSPQIGQRGKRRAKPHRHNGRPRSTFHSREFAATLRPSEIPTQWHAHHQRATQQKVALFQYQTTKEQQPQHCNLHIDGVAHQNPAIGSNLVLPASVHVGGVRRMCTLRPRASAKEQASELELVFQRNLVLGQYVAVQCRNARVHGF